MQPSDFPLLTSALTASARASAERSQNEFKTNPSRFRKPPNTAEQSIANKMDRYEAVLVQITAALEAGEILNPRFLEAKDTLNRLVEEGYRDTVTDPYLTKSHLGQVTAAQEDALSELYWLSQPSLQTASGFLKKVEKLAQKNPSIALIQTAKSYMKEIIPISDAIKTLKEKVVKRITKTDDEKREEKYTPPASSAKAVEQVKAILEDIVTKSYDGLVAYFLKSYNKKVDEYLKAQSEILAGTRERSKRYQSRDSYSAYEYCTDKDGGCDSQSAGLIELAVHHGNYSDPYVRRPNADAILKQKAIYEADDIKLTYIVKNLRKLTSILEAKGDDNFLSAKEVPYREINISYLQGSMRITFNDGSAFTAANSVVFVVNFKGTRFQRFPLTFHDVILPNGVPMKAPSEKRMNTIFIGKAI